jgi:hypothetical protein
MMGRETLVLLPGAFADAELWEDQIRSLQDIVNPIMPAAQLVTGIEPATKLVSL